MGWKCCFICASNERLWGWYRGGYRLLIVFTCVSDTLAVHDCPEVRHTAYGHVFTQHVEGGDTTCQGGRESYRVFTSMLRVPDSETNRESYHVFIYGMLRVPDSETNRESYRVFTSMLRVPDSETNRESYHVFIYGMLRVPDSEANRIIPRLYQHVEGT